MMRVRNDLKLIQMDIILEEQIKSDLLHIMMDGVKLTEPLLNNILNNSRYER
jgi:hypothetical protein